MHPEWFINAVGNGEYWERFEARLLTHPMTARDEEARENLLLISQQHCGGHAYGDPVEYADLAYRLRFEIGPEVTEEALVENRRTAMREATALLSQGVSPRLLGLSD